MDRAINLPTSAAELALVASDLEHANAALRERLRTALSDARAARRFGTVAAPELAHLRWRHHALCQAQFGPPKLPAPPPREIPPDLLEGYSLGGKIEVQYLYGDWTYPTNWPLIYTDFEIDRYLDMIRRRQWYIYGQTDVWLWQAIEKYPISGLQVVNMGSNTPWYEANCLFHGAHSTTIDYQPIITRSSRIKTMTVADWDRDQPTFDMAWSISSFEHDGLGMYGDPLDPEGDLKAMRKMKRIVKPGGLMFLSLPVGRDRVSFNNARIYGRVRLPLLTDGWEQIGSFGLEPVHLDGPGHIQPIFVLRNS